MQQALDEEYERFLVWAKGKKLTAKEVFAEGWLRFRKRRNAQAKG